MKKGVVLLILATVLWSGNYVAGRLLAPAMSAYMLNGVRWTLSALLLLVIMRLRGKRIPLLIRWKELSLLGFVGMFAFSTLNYLGLHTVSAAQAGMIAGTMPAAILLISIILLRDRPTLSSWGGMILSVVGVGLLVMSGHSGRFVFSSGDVELLVASIAWGLYTVLGKRFGKGMDALTMTAGAAVYGAIPSILSGILMTRTGSIHMTVLTWIALFYVSTAASVVAYFAWTAGVELVGASRSAPFINLLPVWTVLLGVILLGENITLLAMLGGAITIGGALLAGRRPRDRSVT